MLGDLTEDQKNSIRAMVKTKMVKIQGKDWHTLDGIKCAARLSGMTKLRIQFEKETESEVRVKACAIFGEMEFEGIGIANDSVLWVKDWDKKDSQGKPGKKKLGKDDPAAKNIAQVANARAISQAIRTALADIIEGYTVDEMWDQDERDAPAQAQSSPAPNEKAATLKLRARLGNVFTDDAKTNGDLELVKKWIWAYCKDLGFAKFKEAPRDFGKVSITENLDLPELAILNAAVDKAKKDKLPNPWMPQPTEKPGPNKAVGFDSAPSGGITVPTEAEKALITRIGNALGDSAKDFGVEKPVVANLFLTWFGDRLNGADIGPVDAAFLTRIPRENLQTIVDQIEECAELATYPWAHLMPKKEKSA